MKRALILSPHPDDGELGCGGTIARMIEEGCEVQQEVLTLAENYGYQVIEKGVRVREIGSSQKITGIGNCNLWSGVHRNLRTQCADLLSYLHLTNQMYQPDIVFMPCVGDLHQDHDTLTREALRVFKKTACLGYEMLWNNLEFKAQCFIGLDERHVQKKIDALQEYKTQLPRGYLDPKFLESLAITRGMQIGKPFAEAFEVIRWVA